MTLVPIHNLDTLNDAQKVEYLKQVCAHFELPEHLNLLEFISMEAGDGAKHMVLYAKKGATDMLRERHGISIVDLQQTITSQAAIFTAKAQDKNGRTEIAVGASSIEGLIGRELANQIMIAQTRATRRVTLQFIGGGFLDESEVFQSQTTNINSLAAATAPVSEAVSSIAKQPTQPVVNATAPKEGRTKEQIDAQAALDKMQGSRLRRHTPTFSLQESEPEKGASIEERAAVEIGKKAVEFATVGLAQNPPNEGVSLQEIPPDIKPDRAEEKALQQASLQTLSRDEQPDIKADIPVPETSTVVPISATPTEEQMKGFKNRLRTFTDEVLPKAGLIPSEGLGGVSMKVRLYAMARYKVMDLKKLTVTQWDDLLTYFDKTDATVVVNQINESLGVK